MENVIRHILDRGPTFITVIITIIELTFDFVCIFMSIQFKYNFLPNKLQFLNTITVK